MKFDSLVPYSGEIQSICATLADKLATFAVQN
jgi:hypothetical protein